MEITALHACTTGLDINHRQIIACVSKTGSEGNTTSEFKEFNTFKRGLRALSDWVVGHTPGDVVMEHRHLVAPEKA